MEISYNVPLRDHLTMALGGPAHRIITVTSTDEIHEAYQIARAENLPIAVLGGGSNTLAHDSGFSGTLICPDIRGILLREQPDGSTLVSAGSGERWDEIVALSVDKQLHGIEALSAIPGTVGAAPVQNIGAYGQELADVFVSLEAYDTKNHTLVTLSKAACEFSYRHSIFRSSQAGRYIITQVTMRLTTEQPTPPFYRALEEYFHAHHITDFTVDTVRRAVISIRKDKLPATDNQPNTGSFFKNALVSRDTALQLADRYPQMPQYSAKNEQVKIPTGWLIEQCALKGKLIHGMRVHPKNALVLINESAKTYEDLARARAEIIRHVYDKFGITIEQEPLELDFVS